MRSVLIPSRMRPWKKSSRSTPGLHYFRDERHCCEVIDRAVREFGQIDVLVGNAAYQMSQDGGLDGITTEQLDRVMKTNVYALF
jgi:NAD(P)-dependent dehydrogenase (short-subunit alcohol dehydrogenase family)